MEVIERERSIKTFETFRDDGIETLYHVGAFGAKEFEVYRGKVTGVNGMNVTIYGTNLISDEPESRTHEFKDIRKICEIKPEDL